MGFGRPFPVRIGTVEGEQAYDCVWPIMSRRIWGREAAVSPFFVMLPAGLLLHMEWEWTPPSPLLLPPSVPTGRFSSGIFWSGDERGQLGRDRARMLSGRRGSSDDHPLLVTARDDPVRASQKPYGTREEGLMRAGSCRNLGKERRPGRRGRGDDATRLSASRL